MYLKFLLKVLKFQLPGRESFNMYGTTLSKTHFIMFQFKKHASDTPEIIISRFEMDCLASMLPHATVTLQFQ